MSFQNLAEYMRRAIQESPDKEALVVPIFDDDIIVGEERINYRNLGARIAAYQQGWKRIGLKKGSRVIVLFRPSADLYAMVVSLIALGMVPVFIDTGMPKKKIMMAMSDSKASAIVSLRALVKLFWFIPSMWKMKRFAIDGKGWGYRDVSWLRSDRSVTPEFEIVDINEDEHGLISFTSGSTGRPKGADRTQGSLENQHKILRSHLPDSPGDIDMTCFPVWVLHNMCCGMTTILPNTDIAKPAEIDPEAIYSQLKVSSVTRLSAAPAFMGRLVKYMKDQHLTLDKIGLAFTGGATVPVETAKLMSEVFPNAKVKIVYGSTEAEPISSVYAEEFINDGQSPKGYLVGKPVSGVEVCISKLPDMPVSESEVAANMVAGDDVGEILVSGDHVLKRYVDNEVATRENKVVRANGLVWHRTGDTGFFDTTGRIWLTGRVKDVVHYQGKWVQPFPIEKQIDELAEIDRSALVQAGDEVVLFIVSVEPVSSIKAALAQVCNDMRIAKLKLVICESIPVDARHNSKIDRPLLRERIKSGEVNYSGIIE